MQYLQTQINKLLTYKQKKIQIIFQTKSQTNKQYLKHNNNQTTQHTK